MKKRFFIIFLIFLSLSMIVGCHSNNNGGNNGNGDKTGDKNNGEIVFPDFELSLPSVVGAAASNTQEFRTYIQTYSNEVDNKRSAEPGIVKLRFNIEDSFDSSTYGLEENKTFVKAYIEYRKYWLNIESYSKSKPKTSAQKINHMLLEIFEEEYDHNYLTRKTCYVSIEEASTADNLLYKPGKYLRDSQLYFVLADRFDITNFYFTDSYSLCYYYQSLFGVAVELLEADSDKIFVYSTGDTLSIKITINLEDYTSSTDSTFKTNIRRLAMNYGSFDMLDSLDLELVAVFKDFVLDDIGVSIETRNDTWKQYIKASVFLSSVDSNPKGDIVKTEYEEIDFEDLLK